MSAWNFAAAAEHLGIQQVAIKSERTPYKDILSPTRAMTDDERRMLTGIVDELYDQFVEVVDQGRPQLDADQVRALANGSIYSANQALENGLVDEIGDADAVERWFRDAIGPAQVIEYQRRPGLRELLFGVGAPAPPTLAQAAERLLQSGTGPRFLYFWPGGR
jgi:protease-4